MDQKLVEEIKSSLSLNKSKEDIYKELLGKGISLEAIQVGFNTLSAEEHKDDTQKQTINSILVIAAVLIAAGIFSFIASNWQAMSKPSKLLVIFIAMLTSYGLGWYFKEKKNLLKTGEALLLLGVLIYGAGIFLVGQMFNITSSWPDAFILWMLGTIAMAYALESISLLYFSSVLGFIAVIWYQFDLAFEYNTTFLFTSTFLLILVTVVTFGVGFVMRKRIAPDLKDVY